MSIRQRIRRWWQIRLRRNETPLDGETPFWLLSLLVHLGLLLLLAVVFFPQLSDQEIAVVTPVDEIDVVDNQMPLIEFDIEDAEELGAGQENALESSLATAPNLSEEIDVSEAYHLTPVEVGEFDFDEYVPESVATEITRLPIRGEAGFATDGAEGAIDRLTHEILLSLKERKTLVVWMFDQSASLLRQRAEILARFDNIYTELESIEDEGGEAFTKHDADQPLLTQVVAFGKSSANMLRDPVADIERIKQAVRDIPVDESGLEHVFGAINQVVRDYKSLRKADRETGEPQRNVMIVIVSDEAGDDTQLLDTTVHECKRNEIPVYCIGVPAPFGRRETFVKYVDPDPQYDQTPQWLPVNQGPESLVPERVRITFFSRYEEEQPIDSGFGPFALTRLCYETGGTYFTVHPNRNSQSRVGRFETAEFSAYFQQFFDANVMRRYRPDYVSTGHYMETVRSNKCRLSLVQAANESWLSTMIPPRLQFQRWDEATFVNQVNQAQRPAALLENKINKLYDILKMGERDRKYEVVLRWKAGYDLAMGRVIATKIRAEGYNKLLAMLKTRLAFENPKNNVWVLKPSNTILTGSASEKLADKARQYLERVIEEHPGTPWEALARKELATPLGWELTETYQEPPQPPEPGNASNNNNRANPAAMPPQKPKRTPKL